MTDRDRLIELIQQGKNKTPCQNDCDGKVCKDSEIVKALKDTLHRIKGAKHLIVPKEGVENLCNGLENALDLINRLQAENEENERLNFLLNDAYENNRGLVELLERAKAEAYKEFAERLKEKGFIILHHKMILSSDIDNILKELVGEENG